MASLCGIAARLVIATGREEGLHRCQATVLRLLRDHDEHAATVVTVADPGGGIVDHDRERPAVPDQLPASEREEPASEPP
ncbi:hypothetical protein AB0L41_41985 [Amycolatopsis mediterranei]|uniref:hypothetical protein n=1 Tax=Amycolatopsis mediterranei TaxID=33910 RepID=UPI0034342FFB